MPLKQLSAVFLDCTKPSGPLSKKLSAECCSTEVLGSQREALQYVPSHLKCVSHVNFNSETLSFHHTLDNSLLSHFCRWAGLQRIGPHSHAPSTESDCDPSTDPARMTGPPVACNARHLPA
eukprot:6484723-Amphidinium_carterae.1